MAGDRFGLVCVRLRVNGCGTQMVICVLWVEDEGDERGLVDARNLGQDWASGSDVMSIAMTADNSRGSFDYL